MNNEMDKIAIITRYPPCDLCLREAVYDCKLKNSMWGYVCEDCFEQYAYGGLGLGW